MADRGVLFANPGPMLMVPQAQKSATPHRSPQPPQGQWGTGGWLPVPRLPAVAPGQTGAAAVKEVSA
jgi:hypothetical protein